MKKYFQWFINALVLVITGVMIWVVLPDYSLDEYGGDTIPDEVIALDEEIDEVLLTIEPNFQELYNNPLGANELDLSYNKSTHTPLSAQSNYAENVESIVYITTEDIDGWIYFGSGSILTEDGVVLTNYHVVEGSTKVVVTTSAGVHYPVTGVIASDELLDVTFLKIDAENLNPIEIGDSEAVRIGDETLVIGHAESFINSLSVGNVAGFRSYESQNMGTNIQITNPISAGNSGGAVLNEYGEIVGIPTWSVEYDQNAVQVQNLNFAVPINEALKLLK